MWEVTNGMLLLQVALSVCLSAFCPFEWLSFGLSPTLITVSMSKCQTLFSCLSVYSSICLLPVFQPACLLSVSMSVYWVICLDGCRFECLLYSSVCLSVCLFVCLFVYRSVSLSTGLFVCQSVIWFVCCYVWSWVWRSQSIPFLHIVGHLTRQSMSSSNLTTLEFLDDLKQGWGVKYGPTLQSCGLDDLDDAQDLSEGDLNQLLVGRALRAVSVPTLHVAWIVKRVYLFNKQLQSSNPFFLPATTITISLHPTTACMARSFPTTCAISTNDREDSVLESTMLSKSKLGLIPNVVTSNIYPSLLFLHRQLWYTSRCDLPRISEGIA